METVCYKQEKRRRRSHIAAVLFTNEANSYAGVGGCGMREAG